VGLLHWGKPGGSPTLFYYSEILYAYNEREALLLSPGRGVSQRVLPVGAWRSPPWWEECEERSRSSPHPNPPPPGGRKRHNPHPQEGEKVSPSLAKEEKREKRSHHLRRGEEKERVSITRDQYSPKTNPRNSSFFANLCNRIFPIRLLQSRGYPAFRVAMY